MGLFTKKSKTIDIHATEGVKNAVEIDSLIYGRSINSSIPGMFNSYSTYEAQVKATYEKYNAFTDFGSQQTRAIIDVRSAFISGEGISVSCKNEATAKWIENFMDKQKLNGSLFVNAVKGSEMAGQVLFSLDYTAATDTSEDFIRVRRLKYSYDNPFKVKYSDKLFSDEIEDIQIKRDGRWVTIGIDNYIYVRTGGDDSNLYMPTTRVGIVLTDIDNYDRALKDIRRNNFVFARVTPTFEVASEAEAKNLKLWLQKIQWKVGTAFIGKAKFKYESPSTTAYQNLESELTSAIKTISSTTGVPVHWLGFVDLMSNRATASSLYESVKNATVSERTIWQEAMYDLIVKAQELYIDKGGNLNLDKDFEVKLPLINYSDFAERVNGLSKAYADDAISIDDYRNELPNIDPLKTAKAVEAEKLEQQNELVKMGIAFNESDDGSENKDDTEENKDGNTDDK